MYSLPEGLCFSSAALTLVASWQLTFTLSLVFCDAFLHLIAGDLLSKGTPCSSWESETKHSRRKFKLKTECPQSPITILFCMYSPSHYMYSRSSAPWLASEMWCQLGGIRRNAVVPCMYGVQHSHACLGMGRDATWNEWCPFLSLISCCKLPLSAWLCIQVTTVYPQIFIND